MLTRKLTRRITQALTRKPTEPGSGGAASFDPASLFSSGEQGVWYDPSDFSTMFQDSAGTTPVTAVEQPVGKILDKSGRGNHASQATAASRPVLSARKNLLLKSEDALDAAWTKSGIQPLGSGSLANVAASGIATADFICESATTGLHRISQAPAQLAERVSFQCKLKSGGRNFATLSIYNGAENLNVAVNLTTGELSAITSQYGSFSGTASATLLPSGFWHVVLNGYRASLSGLQAIIAIGTGLVADFGGTSYAGDGTSGIYVAEAQFETAAAPTTYQSVNTTTDYDTVGFPHYLKFDGVDDGFGATFPAGTLGSNMDCFMLVRRDAATQAALIYGQSASEVAALVISADGAVPYGNAGTPTYAVNGAAVTATRGALHTALPVGNWCVLEIRNLDLSTWTALRFGDFTSNFLNGAIAEVILAPAQSAVERTKARQYLAAKAGITL